MMAAYAAPAYASVGFYFPPFCQIMGSLIFCLMLRSIWKRGREFRELFKIHIHFDDWIDADTETVTTPFMCVKQEVSKRAWISHKFELKFAFGITALFYLWAYTSWYVEMHILRPAEMKDSMDGTKCGCIEPHVNANGLDACDKLSELGPSCRPCHPLEDDPECHQVPDDECEFNGGNCVGVFECPKYVGTSKCQKLKGSADDRCFETCCPSDPNCKKWTDKMENEHIMVNMCPTVSDDYTGYATFSCHADYGWLQMTGTVSLLYLLTVLARTLCLPKSKSQEAIKSALPVVKEVLGMPIEEEEKGIAQSSSEIAA
jgi:hypothetical protein